MLKKVEISHKTIIFTAVFAGLIWLVIQISSIILGLFVSVLLMTALNPVVNRLTRLRLPRGLAILLVYLGLIALVAAGIKGIVPPLIDQTTNLVNHLPSLLNETGGWLESIGINGVDGQTLARQAADLGSVPANLVRLTLAFFSNIIAVFTVLVITFYLLLERNNLDRYLLILFGPGQEKKAKEFVDRLEAKLGGWVRGELILMSVIGLLTYLGLVLLGIPYALPLAILAGLLEVVPTIGPIISAVPGVLLALTVSPVMALAATAMYFLVQQVENSLIVPKIMQKIAGVNPLITIISLTVGFKLAGVLGAVLAVPIIIVIQVAMAEFIEPKDFSKN